jgi:hypothetical protein
MKVYFNDDKKRVFLQHMYVLRAIFKHTVIKATHEIVLKFPDHTVLQPTTHFM